MIKSATMHLGITFWHYDTHEKDFKKGLIEKSSGGRITLWQMNKSEIRNLYSVVCNDMKQHELHIDDLVQDCSISIANAMEILQPC